MASSRLGIDSMTSTMRMTTVSTQPPKAPASSAQDQPADQPDQRGEDADQQRLPAADEQPGQQVAALGVAAERVALAAAARSALRAREVWPISSWAAGSCGAIQGARMASMTNTAMITAPIQNSGDTLQPRQASFSSEVPSSPAVTRESMRCLRARRVGGDHQRVRIRGSTRA